MDTLKVNKVRAYHLWVSAGRPRDSNDQMYIEYKKTKKCFMKRLTALSREYENGEILNAVRMAEMDRNFFWRLIKKARKSNSSPSIGIKNSEDKVVHEIEEVLNVWKQHLEDLGTPKLSDKYDNDHFVDVSDRIKRHRREQDGDDRFLNTTFVFTELDTAIKNLNRNKAPGFDGVTGEHIQYAGTSLQKVLLTLYNYMVDLEYVPVCCRTGVQVPLYKGKNAFTLDPNNYRGLLSVFNQIFEILVWNRLRGWWVKNEVISDLQFASKKGLSCTHIE